MLGTIDPATDKNNQPIFFPDTEAYRTAGLAGTQLQGSLTWNSPTTEDIRLGDTEEWQIWNLTPDAHPIHLHLVRFELVSRQVVNFRGMQQAFLDEAIEEGISVGPVAIVEDGTDLKPMNILMHDGKSLGLGYKAVSPNAGMVLTLFEKDNVMYSDYAQPLDTITALPGQVTTIRATFDKPGRYVWHCHVLSHEDHQMMRVFHVGDLPDDKHPEGVEVDFDNNNSIPDDAESSHDISSLGKLLVTLVLSILSAMFFLWVVYRLIYDANGIIVDHGSLRYDVVPTMASSVTGDICGTSQEDNDEILVQSGHDDENEFYMEEGTLRIDCVKRKRLIQ
jgi:Multicopper oxidase